MDKAGFEYVYPQGTFYLFMKTPEEDDRAFVARAKDDHHMLLSAGSAFECPGYGRIAYCVPYDRIDRSESRFIALAHAYGLN